MKFKSTECLKFGIFLVLLKLTIWTIANGKQAVQEFNQDHTIADLKSFCALAAPGKAFELRAGFPPKPITADDGQSLKDANLLNETVIQRLL